jgi:hypothetical protein
MELPGLHFAGVDDVRVDVLRGRLGMSEPLGQDLCQDAAVMPDRRPPVPEILRGEVWDAGELAGGRHRRACAAVADAGEHSPLGRAILEWARCRESRRL